MFSEHPPRGRRRRARSGDMGDLRLDEVVGVGTHAVVWRATTTSGQQLAAKCVREDDPDGIARLRHEAELLHLAAGRGILPLLDVVPVDGHLALVTPLATSSLGGTLAAGGPLPPARVRRIGLDLLTALATLRRADVVHADLKPDNVLLVEDRWVLGDLGISHRVGHGAVAGEPAGSPAYLDPTHADPTATAGAGDRDLWALAVTLVEAATGALPFDASTGTEVLAAAAAGRLDAVEVPGDPDLGALLTAALTPDPALRPSPATWRERLATPPSHDPRTTRDAIRPGGPVALAAQRPDDSPSRGALPGNRSRRTIAVVAAAAVLATTVGAASSLAGGRGTAEDGSGSDPAGQHDPDGPQHDLQVQHR